MAVVAPAAESTTALHVKQTWIIVVHFVSEVINNILATLNGVYYSPSFERMFQGMCDDSMWRR